MSRKNKVESCSFREGIMTLYHFANCLALAYTPYYLTYKYSGLAEYGAFWKVPYVTALCVAAPTVAVEC
jgi:hypothetical protein